MGAGEAMSEPKHVYQAITAVTAAMARDGISKDRKNEQQGYRFRGIDDVYNALSTHLAEQQLCMLPRVLSRTVTERATKTGGVSTYVVLDVEFDLVSSKDGSIHTIRTMGEAMDSADKATNKAQSAAMKYACLITFQIPTEGDNDADAHHPQKASARNGASGGQQGSSARGAQSPPRAEVAPNDDDGWKMWASAHVIAMQRAKTPGEFKSAFSVAWRDADIKGAPSHIRDAIMLEKDALKGQWAQ